MKRFLQYPQVVRFFRIPSQFNNIHRLKYDFLVWDDTVNQNLGLNNQKQLNDKLLSRILNHKDEKSKKHMVEVYIRMNSNHRLKDISVNYLLKSKMRKTLVCSKVQEENEVSNLLKRSCSGTPLILKGNNIKSTSNVPRLIRGEPGEVIWGFIPNEWYKFFIPVSGHSGFYTFLFTFTTYLFSKEIYVCDHEYYNGLSIVILWVYGVKKIGPEIARSLDKEIDKYELELNIFRDKLKQDLRDSIQIEFNEQECMEGQKMLIKAKRENVHLQREAEFRRRQMEVYENVTRILDYHVAVNEIRKKIQHKNLIDWVKKEVEKNLTQELKESYMKLCLADIQRMLKATEIDKTKK
ncbi:hypothetical protein HHI36_000353 [Cryptolaemus montrouzieri]|uniref:ATP synthase subunit b n=1 Tax=Cryptolaemus montrouzieri TaxID=559131 RepID=A0ABD2P554_9CUCU